MTPILVVGAGPVGLTLAAELARYGVAVRIVERSATRTQTSKALVVWSRTLELMDRMGCTPGFLEAGLRAHGASIRSSKTVLGRATFDNVASPYNFALMIPQRDTERLLDEHLQSFGVSIERQVELVCFNQTSEVVKAKLRHSDGREEDVETPWLIGCDGAHSAVRHALNMEFRGSAQGDDWILADVRLDGDGKPPNNEIAPYLHRDGPFVIFPIPGGRARIVATVGKTDLGKSRQEPTLADVQALIDQRTSGDFKATDPEWISNFRINERKVSDYRQARVFLAGDAAHVHSPAGGQGMNTGMQDAINLGWKLALVARREGAEALLDSYSSERSAVGDVVLRNASLMTHIGTLSNPAAQAARDAAVRLMLGFSRVQKKIAATMSETDIAYVGGPLSQGRSAGYRLDPAQYNGPPPGIGGKPRFVVYAADVQLARALTAQFPAILEPAPRTPPGARDLLIVRPDGYIGLSVHSDQWREAERYLGSFARRG